MPVTRSAKNLALSKILEDIRKIFRREEPDPWLTPSPPKKKITEEEILEAADKKRQQKTKPVIPVILTQSITLVWILLHSAALYVSVGSTISVVILVIVFINLMFLGHYFILLNKERKQQ